jgi:hypothetical protein
MGGGERRSIRTLCSRDRNALVHLALSAWNERWNSICSANHTQVCSAVRFGTSMYGCGRIDCYKHIHPHPNSPRSPFNASHTLRLWNVPLPFQQCRSPQTQCAAHGELGPPSQSRLRLATCHAFLFVKDEGVQGCGGSGVMDPRFEGVERGHVGGRIEVIDSVGYLAVLLGVQTMCGASSEE